MTKNDCKVTILPSVWKYFIWRTVFIAESKSKKYRMYLDGSAIISRLNLQSHLTDAITTPKVAQFQHLTMQK